MPRKRHEVSHPHYGELMEFLPDPEEKPYEKWGYELRRAFILKRWEEAGHPSLVRQTEIVEKFKVSTSQAHEDWKRLKEYIKVRVGKDSRVITELVYGKSIRDAVKNNNLKEAREAVKEWNDWLFDSGVERRAPRYQETKLTGDQDAPINLIINEFAEDADGEEKEE